MSSSSRGQHQGSSSSTGDNIKPVSSKDPAEVPSTDTHLELLTEHFGFNPKTFIDSLVYVANEHLYRISEQFDSFIKNRLKDRPNGEVEAEQGVHAVITLLENALDHTFDTLELYCLRSVFGITTVQAKAMTLAHHRGLDLRSAEERQAHGKDVTTSSADQDCEDLLLQERALQRKITAAQAVQHALKLANIAATRRVDRSQELAWAFSFLVGDDSNGKPPIPQTLPQAARKLRADAATLLKALKELRSTDPLGANLNPLFHTSAEDFARGDRMRDDEAGDARLDRKAWERGREGYLTWETERILAETKKSGSGAGDQRKESDVGNTSANASAPSRSKTPSSAKKRKKGEEDDEEEASMKRGGDGEKEAVGDAAEMESLAAILQD